jgi:putative dimethyl sulfoxide reductase chaperone
MKISLDTEEVLVARALLYRFLALAFHEPGESLADLLTDPEELEALEAAAGVMDQSIGGNAVALALSELVRFRPSPVWPLRELRIEYTRLFIGPGKMPCPPYESVYDQDRPEQDRGTVLGPSARIMEEALSSEGLEVDLQRADLPDHAAIELEFMYYLLSRALDADTRSGAEYLEQSEDFMKRRLAHWLPKFGESISGNTSHPFYRRVSDLLTAMVRSEAASSHQDYEPEIHLEPECVSPRP